MKYPPFQSVEDELTLPLEREAIRKGRCMNCFERYNGDKPVMWTIIKGRMLWWHADKSLYCKKRVR